MDKSLPNIVLVVCDTLGAKHMSLYGYHRTTTPKLEKLVRDWGFTLFTRCYSTSCWTSPAHASMFTGLYPREHGVHERNMSLGENVLILPEFLKWCGYETVGISCNPLVDAFTGFGRGFARFTTLGGRYLFPETDARVRALSRFVTERGGGKWDRVANSLRWCMEHRTISPLLMKVANKLYQRIFLKRRRIKINSTPFTKRALSISAREASGTPSPFFLFINLMQTHHNYNPPPGFRHTWSAKESPFEKLPQDFLNHYYKEPYPQEAIEYFRDLYDEEVLFLDTVLSDFVHRLLSEHENTVVVITSDHGEQFGEDGHYGHILSLADPVTWVPLMVRIPGNGYEVREGLVQLNDIMATIMDLLDSPVPFPSSSRPLFSSEEREEAYMEIVWPQRWLNRMREGEFKDRVARGPFVRKIKAEAIRR